MERFGAEGLWAPQTARGTASRPLTLSPEPIVYEGEQGFDEALVVLDTLLFAIGTMRVGLCESMQSAAHAASALQLELSLENGKTIERQLSFPFPLGDAGSLLKILRLHLEAYAVEGAVARLKLRLVHTPTRFVQHGPFSCGAPEPAGLQITLARISGKAGYVSPFADEPITIPSHDFRYRHLHASQVTHACIHEKSPRSTSVLLRFRAASLNFRAPAHPAPTTKERKIEELQRQDKTAIGLSEGTRDAHQGAFGPTQPLARVLGFRGDGGDLHQQQHGQGAVRTP